MKTLEVKWATSRAQDTYGYTVCTLYVDGVKVARCNGGGYDLEGTVLGDYIAAAFPDRLRKVKTALYGLTFHDPTFDPGKAEAENGKTVEEAEAAGESLGLARYQAFYAASSKVPTKRHTAPDIDGACGTAKDIARAVGLTIKQVARTNRNTIYVLEEV